MDGSVPCLHFDSLTAHTHCWIVNLLVDTARLCATLATRRTRPSLALSPSSLADTLLATRRTVNSQRRPRDGDWRRSSGRQVGRIALWVQRARSATYATWGQELPQAGMRRKACFGASTAAYAFATDATRSLNMLSCCRAVLSPLVEE